MRLINHLPELIEELKEAGHSGLQQDIAQEAGITQSTLSRYMNAHPNSLKIDIEYKLCQYFTEKLGRPINRGDLFSFELEPMN